MNMIQAEICRGNLDARAASVHSEVATVRCDPTIKEVVQQRHARPELVPELGLVSLSQRQSSALGPNLAVRRPIAS